MRAPAGKGAIAAAAPCGGGVAGALGKSRNDGRENTECRERD